MATEDSSIQLAQLDDFNIYASPEDAGVGRHVLAGSYEAEVTAVFRRFLRPGMNVVDIGANIGFFSMLSASIVGPSGSVLAIEPNPANARLVEASRRSNGFDHVTVAQVAVGRETGLLVLNAGRSNGTTSAPSDQLAELLAATTVPCVTVDSLTSDRAHVDFVKIDVEGAEYNALLGASQMLARDRPFVVSEFSPAQLVGISGVDGETYLRWLIDQRYNLGIIELDGSLRDVGGDWAEVMATYRRRGIDHIDIVAAPTT